MTYLTCQSHSIGSQCDYAVFMNMSSYILHIVMMHHSPICTVEVGSGKFDLRFIVTEIVFAADKRDNCQT